MVRRPERTGRPADPTDMLTSMSDHDPTDKAAEAKTRRETVGGSYLEQAINELRASGSSETLFPQHRLPKDRTDKTLAMWVALSTSGARSRRVQYSRSAILYTILAAEAYANQYLQWHLSGDEFKAADKLPAFDKFVMGPRLVHGAALLDRGAEPAQTLRQLLALRTRLVHPKLPTGDAAAPQSLFDDPTEFATFNPRDAARYLVGVADAAGWLMANSDPPHYDMTLVMIDMERDLFLDFGEKAAGALPKISDAPAPDLQMQVHDRWLARRSESDSQQQ